MPVRQPVPVLDPFTELLAAEDSLVDAAREKADITAESDRVDEARTRLACLWVVLWDAARTHGTGTMADRLGKVPPSTPTAALIGDAVDPVRRACEWLTEHVQRVRAENRSLRRRVAALERRAEAEDFERWKARQAMAETVWG